MLWFSSWLPELPTLNVNLALPTTIQQRFLSFVLKKSLGQFFKPGQLDARQIDSQIGSGFVQVNDLEFDTGAINNLISGLPLTLSSGKLSSATVRIPWPKPLTSTLGFSLNSLHLVFELSPATTTHLPGVDLASSVASVAETFLHEELSPREEASLMDSLHSDFGAGTDRDVVPGGLDPFDLGNETEPGRETEPGGISLFATLIERLLSRFEFDAQDIQITLVHPGNTSVTWVISEVKYSTNIKPSQSEASESLGDERTASVARSLNLSGIALQMKDLRTDSGHRPNLTMPDRRSPTSPVGPTRPNHFYQSGSSSSSSSSLDEDTALAMSQSLASLPPRAPPFPQSTASSMYQSALSVVNEEHESIHSEGKPPPVPPTSSGSEDIPQPSLASEEVIFSSGSSPITIQMITIPPTSSGEGEPLVEEDKMSFSVQCGLFACALGPRHIGGLLRLAETLVTRLPQSTRQSSGQTSAAQGPTSFAAFNMEGSLDVRGITLLLLPSRSNVKPGDLQHFFLHPLVPPNLSSGYLRLHIEAISSSLTLLPRVDADFKRNTRKKIETDSRGLMNGTFSIHNVSLFAFRSYTDEGVSAFPILFTDPNLSSQYTPAGFYANNLDRTLNDPLPDFDILDWTNQDHQRKGGARLSYWRCKAKPRQQFRRIPHGHAATTSPATQGEDLPNHAQDGHTIFLSFEKNGKRKGYSELIVEGRAASFHILVDLDTIIGDDTVVNFLGEATQGVNIGGGGASGENLDSADSDITPPATPRARHRFELDKERKRLGRMVIDDLDLEHEYEDEHAKERSKTSRKQHAPKDDVRLSLKLAAVRLQLRAPPPRNIPRSGALIIDLHDIELRNGSKEVEGHARFSAPTTESPSASISDSGKPIFSVDCERIVVAHSLAGSSLAMAFLSFGLLNDNDGQEMLAYPPPLRPRVSVIKSKAGQSMVTALDVQLPSTHVVVTKEMLDGLQYFIDDASQLLERFAQRVVDTEEGKEGGDASLIGSHFFSRSRSNSGSALMGRDAPSSSETVVRVTISEAFLRAWVPRSDAGAPPIRPFDVSASELNVLIELKPEGREETVITLSVLDAKILNVFKTGRTETLLSLTAPRSLTSAPRPLAKVQFVSLTAPGTTSKETKLKLTLCDFTWNALPDLDWARDLGIFVRSPPGTFESVIPSERTSISLRIMGGSIRAYAPMKPGAVVLYAGDTDLATDIVGNSTESTVTLGIQYISLLAIDDVNNTGGESSEWRDAKGVPFWKSFGYALVAEVADASVVVTVSKIPPVQVELLVDGIQLHLHLAADTLPALSALLGDIASTFSSPIEEIPQNTREPAILSEMSTSRNLMASVEDIAFRRPPEIGPAPDMIYDDLPTNPDYLDESFGAAAGLREFSDDELDDLDVSENDEIEVKNDVFAEVEPGEVSNSNGEIIKVHSEGINIIEEYYDNLPAELSTSPVGGTTNKLKIRVRGGDAALLLYDGYDWLRTRKIIEEEAKEMRRRLAKIRQLVANGQVQDLDMEEANTVLFNSVYIGIDQDIDMTEPGVLLAAIDDELKGDEETATQSSWQSLRPTGTTVTGGKPKTRAMRVHGKKLTRSRGPSIEFKLMGCNADIDQFHPDEILVSKTSVTVRDLEILDHIKTSTWKKFLTSLRSDSRGNIRETDSDMVKIELRGVRPAPGHPSEEARLRAKILPLRLYVDQDAVDFLKKFFSFKDPHELPVETTKSSPEAFIQLAEIFPIDLKLDYKPRRVDYRALREGRTIELMNFFHFDGAEMTLRHITLAGVTGWPRLFEMLNDLWTPDVKATQLVDVISGVAPIRSMVNVGSGVADLVLLPISQYKKDGRIVRGIQKGATAFVKSTAIEAIKMGAQLATGTQVILEQAESVLGAQFTDSYTAEILHVPNFDDTGRLSLDSDEEGESDLISKYAEQPTDIREGFQSAYQSLRKNLNTAAQTILAVPMEIYERSGNEGAVRSVIRAVPIAVLKPMIGASEAISKTLLGLHNTLDPNVQRENEAKYKHR